MFMDMTDTKMILVVVLEKFMVTQVMLLEFHCFRKIPSLMAVSPTLWRCNFMSMCSCQIFMNAFVEEHLEKCVGENYSKFELSVTMIFLEPSQKMTVLAHWSRME